jgi:hypothetical protein
MSKGFPVPLAHEEIAGVRSNGKGGLLEAEKFQVHCRVEREGSETTAIAEWHKSNNLYQFSSH